MPDWLPAHRQLVLASGAAELVGGAAALHPRTRGFARWWLTATMAGVFPAHVHMVHHAERYRRIPRWALWARMPLQLAIIGGIWRATA